MAKLTFLTYDQVYGPNRLSIFDKVGVEAPISDFAIVLGGKVEAEIFTINRTCDYFTKSNDEMGNVVIVHKDREWHTVFTDDRNIAVRLVLPYDKDNPNYKVVTDNNYITEIEYGEYPQDIVDYNIRLILNEKLYFSKLKETGRTYTVDNNRFENNSEFFIPESLKEYEYNRNKYVGLNASSYGYNINLSDGYLYSKYSFL